jgi:hypothetical protein
MRLYKRYTDEELIAQVNQYIEDHPNVGRNHIIMHASGCTERVRKLAKEGKINLPKPMPSGSKSSWAKHFKYARETV